MRRAFVAGAALFAVTSLHAQFGTTTPAQQPPRLAPIPPFVLGGPRVSPGIAPVQRAYPFSPFTLGSRSTFNLTTPNSAGNLGYYGSLPYYYYAFPYANPYANRQPAQPTGPSYANPGQVRAVGELAPQLQAPERANASAEWNDARSSFNSASAKVSAARRAVEELRARLEALGQAPRANLLTQTSAAEAALKTAQEQMAAGNLEASVSEIQRANYIAAQVLKEFGR